MVVCVTRDWRALFLHSFPYILLFINLWFSIIILSPLCHLDLSPLFSRYCRPVKSWHTFLHHLLLSWLPSISRSNPWKSYPSKILDIRQVAPEKLREEGSLSWQLVLFMWHKVKGPLLYHSMCRSVSNMTPMKPMTRCLSCAGCADWCAICAICTHRLEIWNVRTL